MWSGLRWTAVESQDRWAPGAPDLCSSFGGISGLYCFSEMCPAQILSCEEQPYLHPIWVVRRSFQFLITGPDWEIPKRKLFCTLFLIYAFLSRYR
ncbi:hypothetical protein GN956_G23229 [Arapaima gigas]